MATYDDYVSQRLLFPQISPEDSKINNYNNNINYVTTLNFTLKLKAFKPPERLKLI